MEERFILLIKPAISWNKIYIVIVKTQEINHGEITPHRQNINVYIYCRESHEAYSTDKQTSPRTLIKKVQEKYWETNVE